MNLAARTASYCAVALIGAIALTGCNALAAEVRSMTGETSGPTVDVEGAVSAALPDAVGVSSLSGKDGFAQQISVTVTWPAEPAVDVPTVQTAARAVCESLEGYDYAQLGFILDGDAGRVDLEPLWSEAYPDSEAFVDSGVVTLWEGDCPVVLAD
ncbi:hypothetical protein MN032_01250 [Agromyces atrinae]|uniref:hypothetical protein n=1 Tax=Agromyces atrinae TaxID=592376 RepID=UPI001F599F01|nr:hypothetical protein [Agromyces atrinae]MCI2956302.1 hypothetical protein [Agromyces atrinae]